MNKKLITSLLLLGLVVGCGTNTNSSTNSSTNSTNSIVNTSSSTTNNDTSSTTSSTSSTSSGTSSNTSSGTNSNTSSTTSSNSSSGTSSNSSSDTGSNTGSNSNSNTGDTVIKFDPEVTFSFESGSQFVLGVDAEPTVTVTEGLDYVVKYENDTYNSEEFPEEAGRYSMVVYVTGNETYNDYKIWCNFTLVENKLTPEITFSVETGVKLTLGVDAEPTVTVTEGLDYTVKYTSEAGYNSEEFPTEVGTYAMVVNVVGNEQYNSKEAYIVFTLEENKLTPEVTFSFEAGAKFNLNSNERPAVTVTEGLDYVVKYENDTYNSEEFPEEAGGYSMVVYVTGNETYKEYKIWCTFTLIDAPTEGYALYVTAADGSTRFISLTRIDELDGQGREQYFGDNIQLNAGDVFQLYNGTNGDAWVEKALESYGQYQSFEVTDNGIKCNVSGTYDIYAKFKWEDNTIYIGNENGQ